MVRFIPILLAVLAASLAWRLLRALFRRPVSPPPTSAGRAEQRGRVVACGRCDLHVPEERAVVRGGRTFCSQACAAAVGRNGRKDG